MATTSRLLSSGSLLVNGEFDENTSISPATFRTTSTAVYATQLDEISFVPGSWTLSGSQGVTVGNSSVFALPGDFTVEFFFYLSSVPSTEIDFWESQTNTTFRILKRGSSSGLSYDAYGGTSYLIASDASIPTNSWNHVAVSRTGTTVQAYFNGTRTINQTDTTSFGAPTANYSIGCRVGGTNSLAGSISNFRLITGAGMYTGATIPVPSAPLGNVTGTQLLLPTPYTGGAFFDYSTNNFTVTKVGAPASGSGNPFTVNTPQRLTSTGILQVENDFDEVSLPAGAIAFNGVNQYLTVPGVPISATGQFTFEAWIYISRGAQTQLIYSQYTTSDPNRWTINIQTSNILTVSHGTVGAVSGTTVPIGQWQHIAVTRNASNTLTIWQDGVSSGSSAGYTSSIYQGSTRIAYYNNTPNDYFFGYISNLRVLNGTALYTATFTPPQSVLPAITNTTLLLNAIDSANFIKDNSPNAYTLTNVNTAIWTPQGPYNQTPSGAISFSGSSQYLTVASSSAFNISGNFTVEGWYYFTAFPGAGTNDNLWTFSGVTTYNPYLYLWGDGTIVLRTAQTSGTVVSVTHNFGLNIWYHIAVVKSSTNFTLYVNGTSVGTGTSSAIVSENKSLEIGGQSTFGLTGYLSNFRVVNGTAVYTSNFTPPNTALTAISGTSLLLAVLNSNNFITDSSANNFTVTNVGTATWTGYGPFNS